MSNENPQTTDEIQEKTENNDINSVFVEGADLKADKLQDSTRLATLINDTLEKQIAVLKLNQMDQDDLRTVVQL
ncbi:hypothetical protein [Ulvibacterium marinum]|uniref:hypothetical protein n=1 Tax=Ulvibacterium marinum TaxID=2419782 RepID=UPI00249559DC|nr:hypothetical protein [Ulvibacterium marinum]